MAKSPRAADPAPDALDASVGPAAAEPEPTVMFTGLVREDGGWSLYRIRIPVSWLAEGERLRDGDSLGGVLAHQRHACLVEAQ